jgi:hypothetical protein
MSWNEGYVVDSGYTYGSFAELNPLRADLALNLLGYPGLPEGPCCELGFGQGMSLNLSAAANPQRTWWGTDFNPEQACFAQGLAKAAGSGAQVFDQSFAQFCAREDLPQFAFIALHGVWSWTSDANRAVIVDFIRRKLMVGGVLYVSYNTLPGWANMLPIRELFIQHGALMSSPSASSGQKMQEALAFVEKWLAANPFYVKVHPGIAKRLEFLRKQPTAYLAHEYLNADWKCMPFAEMAQCLTPAKVSYAGSAQLVEQIDGFNLTPEQRTLLGTIPPGVFHETTRELLMNQQFRRDLWVKGSSKMKLPEQLLALRKHKFVMAAGRAYMPKEMTCNLGKAPLKPETYGPLYDLFDKYDQAALTLGQIIDALQSQGQSQSSIVQSVAVLTASGGLHLVQPQEATERALPATQRLNKHLLERAAMRGEVTQLASPVTGTAVGAPHLTQLFLLARQQGNATPAQWAAFAQKALVRLGQKIVKENNPVDDVTEQLTILTQQATQFESDQLPTLLRLKVV